MGRDTVGGDVPNPKLLNRVRGLGGARLTRAIGSGSSQSVQRFLPTDKFSRRTAPIPNANSRVRGWGIGARWAGQAQAEVESQASNPKLVEVGRKLECRACGVGPLLRSRMRKDWLCIEGWKA